MKLEKPIVIAINREAKVKIVRNKFTRPADILSHYFNRITQAEFDIVETTSVLPSVIFKTNPEIKHDGFSYYIFDKDIMIESASEQGFVYAVYDFLERIVGCRYYTKTEEYVPSDVNLTIFFEKYAFEPILQYREDFYKGFEDEIFCEKHKMSPASKHNGWGFWCHSFETLVNPKEYFNEHPEYFSLYEGQRVGTNAQLCLSNPDVYRILVENLRKHMEQNPDALYWSVSQNDNNAYCQCEECRKMNEYDESPMGSVLHFVNKVAAEFPDKIISTLAYWYTRTPPKHTRPANNVHIMLCNIEANRGLPIEKDTKSIDSKNELLAWKKICKNVFLWDYCIQFRNLVSPFPNLRVIPQNIRFFVENNVRSLFSQANREYGGEFSELRGYLLAKMMWDPYCDAEAVIQEFVDGYYKQAAPYIIDYINAMHDALEQNGGELSIFGSPSDYEETFLTPELFETYENYFDCAENAVSNDLETLFRVKTVRLPLYYAGICLKYGSRQKQLDMIAAFTAQAKKTGLIMVEEWSITVEKFVTNAIANLSE
ncbi:DUF4838 domain-containing protein [Paludicola sp. MB14-C6]|uniref:DUF4838 domain-containing protein n=1 Tax=Paludihabitans sp. MB14-C6 TaxID=3070656 RepID=UPI0027DE67D8|nr:DUF4838 domain-containing protein [Paludicola sp. MB14-C6]WMJ24066.1 DUF4838 domain-containing protein [Paludicola sp. MB14-C6]